MRREPLSLQLTLKTLPVRWGMTTRPDFGNERFGISLGNQRGWGLRGRSISHSLTTSKQMGRSDRCKLQALACTPPERISAQSKERYGNPLLAGKGKQNGNTVLIWGSLNLKDCECVEGACWVVGLHLRFGYGVLATGG